MMRRALMVTGTALTVLALTAANANAAGSKDWGSKTATVGGGTATCKLVTWAEKIHDDHAKLSCSVKDTKKDGNDPYVRWWQDGFGYAEFAHNRKGYGKTVTGTDARKNGHGSFGTVYYKVCLAVNNWPDNCGGTKTWDLD